jgi:phosphate transport system substrate-binding protein
LSQIRRYEWKRSSNRALSFSVVTTASRIAPVAAAIRIAVAARIAVATRIAAAAAAVRIAAAVWIVAGVQAVSIHTACASDALPEYQKVGGVSGNLNFIGSDTMINLMSLWGEAFQQQYPGVRVQGEGKGSSTAPPALIAGTAELGPMSRAMKSTEVDEFVKAHGYPPTAFRVALDALAIYVNKDNPIADRGLTMPQIDAIFGKTRKGGYTEDVLTWGQLGLTGTIANKPISLYGRNSASGTYGYFKERALFKGDFKDTVKEQPGSASVVQGVENDLYAIGYSGMGYSTSGARKVPLASKQGETPHAAELENVISGEYPLARFLYIYVNKAPGQPLDPLVHEFLTFVFSAEGQAQVDKDGFIAVPANVAQEELVKLN